MKTSYIITTYNRVDVLKRHIDLIRNSDVEIIVADDGSPDGTREYCENEKRIDFYVNSGNYDKATPAKARNMGIEKATGDLLIFADDDCLPHKDLIEQFKKMKRGFVGVGYKSSDGSILEIDSENIDEITKSMKGMSATLYFSRYLNGSFFHGHFTSGSFAVWRDDLGDVRFDEDFVGYGYEDKHFGYLLFKKGLKFDYMVRAMSYHTGGTYNRPREQKTKEAETNKKLMNEKIKNL